MKFRIIVVVIFVVVIMLGMGVCGFSIGVKDDKIIMFWYNVIVGDGKQYWEDMVKVFEKKIGVKVQIQVI